MATLQMALPTSTARSSSERAPAPISQQMAYEMKTCALLVHYSCDLCPSLHMSSVVESDSA